MKPNLFNTLSVAPEVNAQRNKTSLLGTKSSGIAHFRMTHLNRREVVMDPDITRLAPVPVSGT